LHFVFGETAQLLAVEAQPTQVLDLCMPAAQKSDGNMIKN